MTDFIIPYEFDETHREYHVSKCDGSCPPRLTKSQGPLWIEICLDPKCAKVYAKCEHMVVDPKRQQATPLSPTQSINKWNDEGTILTCQYCGKDVT